MVLVTTFISEVSVSVKNIRFFVYFHISSEIKSFFNFYNKTVHLNSISEKKQICSLKLFG
jgi:hypothetical protein